ncbi:MAG: HD domain-containing protein [Candidatus Micrarchaeia archaeon]
MTSPQYTHHAKAGMGQMLLFDIASRYQPVYEGLVTMHISKRMIGEEKGIRDRSMKALIASSRKRLEETDHGLEKWRYTRAHSLHVANFAYIIASEARKLGLPGIERISPELAFAGGFVHDIGKTFLPLALMVKELGARISCLCLWEGRPLNSVEKKVLRDQHISAGTKFVRLFNGEDNPVLLDMVGLHHVMFNGKGSMYPSYPANLTGIKLPLQSRIAKTADFISAVLPRHYRKNEWVHSAADSLGYAVAVSGVELDPTTVKCFMLGTHEISPEEADGLMVKLRYPGSVADISDFELMKRYVKEVVEEDPEFRAMIWRKSPGKIDDYLQKIGRLSSELDAPTIESLVVE